MERREVSEEDRDNRQTSTTDKDVTVCTYLGAGIYRSYLVRAKARREREGV